MKTSGEFRLHEFTIPVISNRPITLSFFGDVHRDSPLHALSAWRAYLTRAKANVSNTWFIGMGDYIDAMSTSEREGIARAGLHESTAHDMESGALAKTALLTKELDFMRGRIIGLLNGNHFFLFPTGINSDQKLCERLDAPYLGCNAFVRLNFRTPNGHIDVLTMWLHHGAGGNGRLLGGDINRIDQCREHADADIYAMGHTHKRAVVPSNPRLLLAKNKGKLSLVERQQWLLRTGSFLAAYEHGQRSYNVDAARGPCSLGNVELEITPRFTSTREVVNGKKVRRQTSRLEIRGIS